MTIIYKSTWIGSNPVIIGWVAIRGDINNWFICLIGYVWTDLDSELMLFNEEANEVIVYVLAWIIVINIY